MKKYTFRLMAAATVAFPFFTHAQSDYYYGNTEPIRGLNLAIGTGAWWYTGNMAALEKAPMTALSFHEGGKMAKLSIDFTASILFATVPGTFVTRKTDTLYFAQYQTGLYTGIDLAYQLYRHNRSEIDGLLGVGFDLFGCSDSTQTIDFGSTDLNIGLGYRLYLNYRDNGYQKKYSYLSLQAKYHLLDFNNPGGTPMGGNAVSLTLDYGGFFYNYGRMRGGYRGSSGFQFFHFRTWGHGGGGHSFHGGGGGGHDFHIKIK